MDEDDVAQDVTELEPVVDTRSELQVMVSLRDKLQKLRIAEGNRAFAEEQRNQVHHAALHRTYESRLHDLELAVTKDVAVQVREHPAWPWLKDIHGVAETSAGSILAFPDITIADTASSFWKFAGFGTHEAVCPDCDGTGKLSLETQAEAKGMKTSTREMDCPRCRGTGSSTVRDRPVKGEKLSYSIRMKTAVWRLIDLQVKKRGPYRDIYDAAKHTYLTTRPTWTLGHVEAASRRKAAKLFLSHLWQVWREAEGLPVRMPFIIEKGEPGAHDFIDPHTFVDRWNEEHRKGAA